MRRQVTKQMILIVTCLVFALALSGAVAAEDSQGGELDDTTLQSTSEQSNSSNNDGSNELDPRIYGVIKEDTTPTDGATVTIKNPTTNAIIASGTTNSSGEYDISFLSDLTEFKVEIAYLAYKNYTTTVTPTGSPIPMANLNYTFMPSQMLKPTKMVVIIGGYGFTPVQKILDAYKELNLEGYDFDMKVFYHADLAFDADARERFANELKTANIFFMTSGFSSTQPQSYEEITQLIDIYLPNDATIVQTGSYYLGERDATKVSYGFSGSYSKETIKKVFLNVLKISGTISDSTDINIVPEVGEDLIYHPDASTTFKNLTEYMQWYTAAGKLKPDGTWIGFAFDYVNYDTGDLKVMDAIIRDLESKGINVIPLGQKTPLSHTGEEQFDIYRDAFYINGTPLISALIVQSHSSGIPKSIAMYEEMNVPIIGAMMIGQTTLADYLENSTGITGGYELNLWTVGPELAGRVGNVLVGGMEVAAVDEATGMEIKLFTPYQPGVNQLCNMAIAWANLKNEANSQKKVALVYCDNTHDETMPIAAGLNLPESLSNILEALTASGYDLGSYANLDATELLALINDHGRNLNNYTQDDLLNLIQKGAITITKDEYLQWYSQLPSSLREQVEAVWGSAPGNMMVYEDKIVIPGMILGNIFLGPQPIWKWNGTISSLYDSENLPPTHQYIAFYLWMQNKFQADAYVQVGDHSTLELLPGHSLGMTEDDWPNTLIGYMPHIYIRNMAGEDATASKRRAYALIITHLTPAVAQTELYGNLGEMHDLLTSFQDAYDRNDTARMAALKPQILNKINSEPGLSERLGITSTTNFGIIYNQVHNYLHSIMSQVTTYGLHTFGELPDNETLEKFIDAIIAFDPANRTSRRDEIRELLVQSASNEMSALLNALTGGYIEPGTAGDPVRSLDTLPAGRNKYTFDPRKVPDSAAMVIGSDTTETMLKRYIDTHGANNYPETVAIPVSGGEVMLTYGQSIASIFYLLGVKPVYSSGMVVGVEVIPLSELGRPRIDVLIQASSSLRDACPDVVRLIDEAIEKVALLDESTESNYVRKHYLAMMPVLEAELLAEGKSVDEAKDLAEKLARSRIFGLPPGADPHGVGVARLMNSDSWTEEELAETYLDYNSYIYGNNLDGMYGSYGRTIMEKLLKTVDTTMVVSASGISGQHRYFGSATLNNVVKYLTNKDITSYIVLTSTSQVLTLQESMYDDLTLTLFNPTWRDALLKEGYSGRATIALRIRGMFRSDALADIVSSASWQRIADNYLFDQNVFSQFDSDQQKMIANAIYQANMRGMMQLNSAQASQLAQILGMPVTGQTTTTSTNSGQSATSPGAVGQSSAGVSYQSSSSGVSSQTSTDTAEAGDQSAGDSGKTYEVSKATSQGVDDTPWGAYAVVGVISVLALAGLGFFFKGSLLGR
ncbi:MAG: cobaltochelatase subunit CobN [Methanobacterium sp.]|nr:cobaltochelatase subunit CobN [Methanobacterium sp.]